MVTKLTEKIEELTLHIIALDKKNNEVTMQLDTLKNKN
jgi:chaperonin cofactor prefoldin